MKFGRIDDVSTLDLTLPTDHAGNSDVLKNLPGVEKQNIYVGGTKWGRKEWIGTLFPEEAKEKDLLQHYGKMFNSIELNATFHRFPPENWISKWKDQVPDGFKFCPKVYRSVSHRYFLNNTERLMDDFLVRVQGLENKLGCIFLQLSDKFAPKQMERLIPFVERLPKDIDFAMEFRHEGWFNDSKVTDELHDLCLQNNVGLVLTDAPGRRDVLHMRLSSAVVMVRFVGHDLHSSDYFRMDQWVERLAYWYSNGLHDFYFLVHQHDEMDMLKSCQYFAEKVNEKMDLELIIPGKTRQ